MYITLNTEKHYFYQNCFLSFLIGPQVPEVSAVSDDRYQHEAQGYYPEEPSQKWTDKADLLNKRLLDC